VIVGGDDVLAGLDAVDWAGLTHAYGSATDVPGLIRALTSTEPGESAGALDLLYGNIFHQGSRYEATASAVPFLARLAADPQIRRRDEIVLMLAALAIGYDEAYLPAGINIAGWRAEVEQARSASRPAAYGTAKLTGGTACTSRCYHADQLSPRRQITMVTCDGTTRMSTVGSVNRSGDFTATWRSYGDNDIC
jgi:hypothetical protein